MFSEASKNEKGLQLNFCNPFFLLVPLARFERVAHGLGNQKNVNSNPLIMCLISRNY